MYHDETKTQFIELRARDISYDKIAEQLQISKGIAVLWGRQYAAQIQNLALVEREAMLKRHLGGPEQELSTLVARLRRLEAELDGRKEKYMPTRELMQLINDTRKQIDKFRVEPVFVEEPETSKTPSAA